MGSSFDLGFQSGHEAGAQARAQKTSMDMLQRQFLAEQWQNAANNVTLPPQQIKDETTGQMIENPAYQKAAETRAKYIKSAHDAYSPDHHANLFDSIHGLITGKQEGAQPQTPPAPNEAPTAAPGSTPGHAFQQPQPGTPNHSLMAEGDKILHGIGRHLKAFAHPIAPQPGPDWKSLGQAPGPQDVALAAEKRKNEFALQLEAAKEKDRQDDINSRKKPQLKAYTLPDGSQQWLDASDPTKVPPGAKPVLTVGGKPKDSQAALATYIRAKYGENPTWQEIAEGTAEHQRLMAGVTVGSNQKVEFDADGIPHIVTLQSSSHKEFTPPTGGGPVSSQSPQFPGDTSQFMVEPNPKGLVEAGNIPIWNRPTVQNADGSHSSEYSTSFQDDDGHEVLVPTVVGGKFLTPDGKKPQEKSQEEKAMFKKAWQHYLDTGENLGKFDNPDDADAYAGKLHNRGAKPKPQSSISPKVPDSMAGPNARLNAKKPQSKQIPNQLNFRKATPAGTKANELVDTAQNSYLDVQKAGGSDGKSLDPVGSQGVVLAWLRGRVNRVTQSEINSVRNLGGIFQKFDGSVSSLVKGTMSPQQYKWFLDSAKRNYENAQEVAKKYKSPQSSASPQVPSSGGDALQFDPKTGTVH